MVQNLWWAAGYNIVAIPLAAGVLYPIWHYLLPPAIGAVVMSLSTVIVAVNAKLLGRVENDLSRRTNVQGDEPAGEGSWQSGGRNDGGARAGRS
jgi:hypothetical protein